MGAALAAAPSLARGLGAQRPTTARDGGALEPAARVPVNATRHTLLRGGTVITMDPALGDFAKGDRDVPFVGKNRLGLFCTEGQKEFPAKL